MMTNSNDDTNKNAFAKAFAATMQHEGGYANVVAMARER